MSGKKNLNEGWRRTKEAAELFGMTVPGFHQVIRPMLSPEHLRTVAGAKRALEVHIPSAIAAYAQNKAEKAATAAGGPDAELLAGGDSPALERYRLAKAQLTEIELDQRRKNVIPLESVKGLFGTVASHIRRGLDTLQRQFGRDAYTVMKDSLADAKRDFDHGIRKRDNQ